MNPGQPEGKLSKEEVEQKEKVEIPPESRIEISVPEISPARARVEERREWTRVLIAGGLTLLYAVSILALFYRILFDPSQLPEAHLDTFKTSFALLSSTYGVIIGFYFGASREQRP